MNMDTLTGSDFTEPVLVPDEAGERDADVSGSPDEKVLLRHVREQLTDVFRASFLAKSNRLPEGILDTSCVHELVLRLSERYVRAQREGRDPMIAISSLVSEIAEDRQGVLTNAFLRYAETVERRDGMHLRVANGDRTTLVSTNKKGEYAFLTVLKSDIKNFLHDVVNRIHTNGFQHRVDFETVVHESFDTMFDVLDQRLSPRSS